MTLYNTFLLFVFAALLRVMSAILLFGNMKFQQDRKSDQATLPDNTGLYESAVRNTKISWVNTMDALYIGSSDCVLEIIVQTFGKIMMKNNSM